MDCFAALAMTLKYLRRTSSPAKAGNQYAAAYQLHHCCLWNTGSSAFADDDD